MALFNTISDANRVEVQGNTYFYTTEARYYSRWISPGHSIPVEYVVNLSFQKQYSYVGLSESAAKACAETIRAAYVMQRPNYDENEDYPDGRVQIGNTLNCYAAVSPCLTEGNMWEIQVQVAAEIVDYFKTVPQDAEIMALVSPIANFPERQPAEEND